MAKKAMTLEDVKAHLRDGWRVAISQWKPKRAYLVKDNHILNISLRSAMRLLADRLLEFDEERGQLRVYRAALAPPAPDAAAGKGGAAPTRFDAMKDDELINARVHLSFRIESLVDYIEVLKERGDRLGADEAELELAVLRREIVAYLAEEERRDHGIYPPALTKPTISPALTPTVEHRVKLPTFVVAPDTVLLLPAGEKKLTEYEKRLKNGDVPKRYGDCPVCGAKDILYWGRDPQGRQCCINCKELPRPSEPERQQHKARRLFARFVKEAAALAEPLAYRLPSGHASPMAVWYVAPGGLPSPALPIVVVEKAGKTTPETVQSVQADVVEPEARDVPSTLETPRQQAIREEAELCNARSRLELKARIRYLVTKRGESLDWHVEACQDTMRCIFGKKAREKESIEVDQQWYTVEMNPKTPPNKVWIARPAA